MYSIIIQPNNQQISILQCFFSFTFSHLFVCFFLFKNIHLVARWLGTLEKLLERFSEGSHENFQVIVSAEPSSTPEGHIIPQGILENSIKITNEPPTGMHANLHKALDNFNQVTHPHSKNSGRRNPNIFFSVILGTNLFFFSNHMYFF